MKILKKIKCNKRLPSNKGEYFCINKGGYKFICYFDTYFYYLDEDYTNQIEYWYEPIEISLESEEILPLEQRGLFSVCFSSDEVQDYAEELEKALEAAEKEIVKLKDLTSILCEESRILNYEAKERYNKALKYGMENTHVDNIIIKALKIVSGILK